MSQISQQSLTDFFLAGISYEKADVSIRSSYAVDDKTYASVLTKAAQHDIREAFILSTCNRTEIYGFAKDEQQLINLLCSETNGNAEQFGRLAYIRRGKEAAKHLYCVAAGLDSQILGDYEVVGQVKNAARFAKEHGSLGAFTDRLISSVLHVSKQIKNETKLSSGTISVAFAAVQFLKTIPAIEKKKILLIGTGKIGRNTCKNMMSYFGTENITLINRTQITAVEFASEYHLNCVPFSNLTEELNKSDIILVASNADKPINKKSQFKNTGNHIILDLSVPKNVSEEVKSMTHIKVIDVDELSKVQDHTIAERRKEIPKAMAIIDEQMQDFLYWHQMRKHAVVLQEVKKKLEQIHRNELKNLKKDTSSDRIEADMISARIVQKMINVFAGKLRQANGEADNYLHVLSEIFEIPLGKQHE
ncbi:MAG: glutamyl-tRNA reductase [Chitinophagaceae bacterium]